MQPSQMCNLTASVRMQGETVSSTFKTAGTYEYYCEPHQGAHIRCISDVNRRAHCNAAVCLACSCTDRQVCLHYAGAGMAGKVIVQ